MTELVDTDWTKLTIRLKMTWKLILGQLCTVASVLHSVLVSNYGGWQELEVFLPSLLEDLILFLVLWRFCSLFVIWSHNSLVKTGRISGGNWSSVMPLCHLNCKNSWFYQILGVKKQTTTKLSLILIHIKWCVYCVVTQQYLFIRR